MPATFTRNCAFAGILPVYLKTYTTTYPFLRAGWAFNQNALQPMEFEWYLASAFGPFQAFESRLIDFATGYTKITAGNKAGGVFSNVPANPVFGGSKLKGFFDNLSLGRVANWGSWYAPVGGGDKAYASLGLAPGITVDPVLANTATPWPGAGDNWLIAAGVYTSSATLLQTHSRIASGDPGAISDTDNSTMVPALSFPTNARFNSVLTAPDGRNYILISDGSGGAVPYLGIQTDFASFANTIDVELVNPATFTTDLNALFKTANNTGINSVTGYGWLWIYKTVDTFNGVTLNGYGVLIAPDFSQYALLQFLPQDAIAAAWNTGLGSIDSKADRNGGIWLKNFSSDTTLLFGSLGSPSQMLPVSQIPPRALVVNPALYR